MNSNEHDLNEVSSLDEDAVWEFLADLLDEFCRSWESAPPNPKFDSYATRLDAIDSAEFRRIGLIELIKVEFEFRSAIESSWKNLASYMDLYPELGQTPPAELTSEERRLAPDSKETNRDPSLMQDFQPESTQTLAMHRSREAHRFQPGDSVDDFDLLSKLGRGAFATVFLARQNSMQRLVALKISADEGLEGPTLAKLNHPHVVRVFDQRVVEERKLRLMYMEYVPGGSLNDVIKHAKEQGSQPDSSMFLNVLDQRLADAGNSPPAESTNREWIKKSEWASVVAKVGAQLAEAIAYTHSEGILHRDIKPANVLVDQHGSPRLVDFNISYGSKVIGATAASSFGGSLRYMSPEQLEAFHPERETTADEVGEPTDTFALGVMLYELLFAKQPFSKVEEVEPFAMIDQMIVDRKNGLSESRIAQLFEVNPVLAPAIANSLHPNPEARPDVSTLGKQLRWASDAELSDYLQPSKKSWRYALGKFPWLFIFATVIGVSLFATGYVTAYNIGAIASEDLSLFYRVLLAANGVAYSIGTVLLMVLFYQPSKALHETDNDENNAKHFETTVTSNLDFGHRSALAFLALWTVFGLLIPVALTVFNAKLENSTWFDFLISHLMAGLICGAFVFFGLTLYSFTSWHPSLALIAAKKNKLVDIKPDIKRTRKRMLIHRVIAVGAPFAAIAMLAIFRESNPFAVACLSIAAFVGLGGVAWAISKINGTLDLLERT